MVPERLAWVGAVVMSGVGIYLSYVPLANDLGRVAVVVLGAIVVIAALLMFPWGRTDNGTAVRLANRIRVDGHDNQTQVAGDNSSQYMAGRNVKITRARETEG